MYMVKLECIDKKVNTTSEGLQQGGQSILVLKDTQLAADTENRRSGSCFPYNKEERCHQENTAPIHDSVFS